MSLGVLQPTLTPAPQCPEASVVLECVTPVVVGPGSKKVYVPGDIDPFSLEENKPMDGGRAEETLRMKASLVFYSLNREGGCTNMDREASFSQCNPK